MKPEKEMGVVDERRDFELLVISCKNRVIDIVFGPEGDNMTGGEVRQLLEREYGQDICRAAFEEEERWKEIK